MPNPFQLGGQWLRGNLHTHTTNSDGCYIPEQAIEVYAAGGYDFLAITDHDKVTEVDSLQGRGLTVLPGAEVHIGPASFGQTIHIVMLGAEAIPQSYYAHSPAPPAVLPTLAEWCQMCILAHPFWSLLQFADVLPIEGYIGVEVYNTTCEYGVGRGPSEMMWDILLAEGRQVWGLAVDDIHFEHDAMHGWVMVKAQNNSPEAIYAALREGLFYSSNGPEIHNVQIEGDQVQVECSPCREIAVIAAAPGQGCTSRRLGIDPPIEHICLPLPTTTIPVRLECIDEAGRKAWSNPFFPADNPPRH